MKTEFKGRVIAAACLLGLAMGNAAMSHSASAQNVIASQTTGLTADGTGIQLTYNAAPGELFLASKKGSDLLTQTLHAFQKQFASQQQSASNLALTIAVNPNRQLAFVVRPTAIPPDNTSGTSSVSDEAIDAEWPGRPGQPPGYPATPDEVTDVVYRQVRNGYQRDTQYHRRPPTAQNPQPGPWQMVGDTITFIGGGGGGGGGSSVIVHPPVASEEDPQ